MSHGILLGKLTDPEPFSLTSLEMIILQSVDLCQQVQYFIPMIPSPNLNSDTIIETLLNGAHFLDLSASEALEI